MSKTRKIIVWSFVSIIGLAGLILCLGFWFMSMIPTAEVPKSVLKETTPSEITYLSVNNIQKRGKILAVVTSVNKMGASDKTTGYELTELARAYYVFQANGFEVVVASPKGGKAPVVIDKDDMKEFDYAFLNDPVAMKLVDNTVPIAAINPDDFEAIYFVGGKGAMFDFPNNQHIQSIVKNYYEAGKVVGAVCHGPAALINVQLSDGKPLIANKTISGFTNEEELLLIPDAKEIFPYLLQDQLSAQGANFKKGFMYLNNVSTDNNLVTGQNPWSTWEVAETMIKQMGYEPKKRAVSPEENTISLLRNYEKNGFKKAKLSMNTLCKQDKLAIDRELLGVHALLAAYQFRLLKSTELTMLLSNSNDYL